MLNTIIIGASGYAGAELVAYLQRHTEIEITGLFVSEKSTDAGKLFADVHPRFMSVVDLPLQPLTDEAKVKAKQCDVVFLATEHEVSHDLAAEFLQAGCVVFDLSGAHRINNVDFYSQYYRFKHLHTDVLSQAVYGLAEWQAEQIKQSNMIAVPGCYPTASLLALKPLVVNKLLDQTFTPVINAVSGVSGAGRKASLTTSFCEVSFNPYGVFTHRHQPEITHHLGTNVIFTPHLGNFPRGILATITARLTSEFSHQQVMEVYQQTYADKPLVRLYKQGLPSIKSVAGLPYCDIGLAIQDEHIIIVAAEDNLLKGAAAQAVQCLNLRFGFVETQSLI